jgi:hypothetical protein
VGAAGTLEGQIRLETSTKKPAPRPAPGQKMAKSPTSAQYPAKCVEEEKIRPEGDGSDIKYHLDITLY